MGDRPPVYLVFMLHYVAGTSEFSSGPFLGVYASLDAAKKGLEVHYCYPHRWEKREPQYEGESSVWDCQRPEGVYRIVEAIPVALGLT